MLGNRDSFLNIDLPLVDEPDPLHRLDRISAETRRRKRLDDADEMYDLFHALGWIGKDRRGRPTTGRECTRVQPVDIERARTARAGECFRTSGAEPVLLVRAGRPSRASDHGDLLRR